MEKLSPSKYNRKELYIDAEWFITQKMYLIGYAYNMSQYGQLWGKALNARNIKKMLKGVERIYFYGPDIGMLENSVRLVSDRWHTAGRASGRAASCDGRASSRNASIIS